MSLHPDSVTIELCGRSALLTYHVEEGMIGMAQQPWIMSELLGPGCTELYVLSCGGHVLAIFDDEIEANQRFAICIRTDGDLSWRLSTVACMGGRH